MNACLLFLCLSLSSPSASGPSLPGGARSAERWVGEDKFKHFFTSFVATSLAAAGARSAGLDAQQSLVAGAGAGAGVGVWKEIRDARTPGGFFSVRDLVWDLAGVGAAVVVVSQAD